MTEFKIEEVGNGWIIDFRQNVTGPSDPYNENTTRGKIVSPDIDGVMDIIRGLIDGDT